MLVFLHDYLLFWFVFCFQLDGLYMCNSSAITVQMYGSMHSSFPPLCQDFKQQGDSLLVGVEKPGQKAKFLPEAFHTERQNASTKIKLILVLNTVSHYPYSYSFLWCAKISPAGNVI